jgi:hypothetical protein
MAHAPHAQHVAAGAAVMCAVVMCLVLGLGTAAVVWIWRADRRAIRLCPVCAAPAVRTLVEEGVKGIHAWLILECGQCGTWRRILTSPSHARLQARAVARDRAAIRGGLERLDVERRRGEIDALTRALRSRIVGAEDFLAATRPGQRTGQG